MRFYLGTHEPSWLNRSRVPLFVSAVRLRARCKRKLPRARVPWALDSGGFSVIQGPEGYPQTAEQYAAEVRRWSTEIGHLDWAAIQDWMCEPVKLALTGYTLEEHQRRTVRSWVELRAIAPDLPWVPVLQGFSHAEYLRCADFYAAVGTDLTHLPVVGIGSVCRREDTAEAERIIRDLAGRGFSLHGFGFKLGGLERCSDVLASADSLAWSYGARRRSAEARRRTKRMARMADLFDCGEPVATKTKSNDARTALAWLRDVEVRARMKEEAGSPHPCPWCGSNDVHPPCSSELDYCCVECGETWGDIREPDLYRG